MKKLIQSAFALSLIITSLGAIAQTEAIDDTIGIETELMPELLGHQRFSPTEMHEGSSWKVTEKDVLKDKEPLKGQGYSIIPWKTLDPEAWLDIEIWMSERAIKDKNPDWKMRLRDERNHELMGRVIKCVGTCEVYRGTKSVNSEYLSRLHEGDEIKTLKNSLVWIYLMDGTLVRLGAESALTLQEMNFTKTEAFVLARLNQGHLFWHPRPKNDHSLDFAPETDAAALPLMLREANLEHFEREIFAASSELKRLQDLMDPGESGVRAQVRRINELRSQNSSALLSRSMIVAPNATLISGGESFHFLHFPAGKSYFKRLELTESKAVSLDLRGYTDFEQLKIQDTSWHEVEQNGRTEVALSDPPGELQVSELLTKRIKTLELVRELWFAKFTLPVQKLLDKPKLLATTEGYNLWGDELQDRQKFLSEYTRRIETTNLRSMENLAKKLEDRGETVTRQLSSAHYEWALNYYLKGLKSRYTSKKMKVREMSDLQYYVWILKNGKL